MVCLPTSSSAAGQLFQTLQTQYASILKWERNRWEWPTPEKAQSRFEAVAAIFGVKMELLTEMPLDLVTDRTAYWYDAGSNINYPGPAYKPESWPKDGYWVVRTPREALCFRIANYPAGGGCITFSLEQDGARFDGYGQMPIDLFFECLFCHHRWCNDMVAVKVAEEKFGLNVRTFSWLIQKHHVNARVITGSCTWRFERLTSSEAEQALIADINLTPSCELVSTTDNYLIVVHA